MKQAVLFDLDGTLLDTLEDLATSVNRVLESMGFPVHPIDSYRYFVGDGAAMLFRRALPPDRLDEATMARSLGTFREVYGGHWNVATTPYAGIPELLDDLVVRGVKLAVLSNKPHALTAMCVDGLLGKWRFDVVLGQRDGVPKKPDPTAALEIAGILGLPPEEILYLGDTGTDMNTAVGAGMYPVGALWGFRPADELVAHGARSLILHPRDLIGLLDA